MYLLMLLATYLSAIYGYNLSARPEFDRDVLRKKAAAVLYKHTFHHNAAYTYVFYRTLYDNGDMWVFPNDMFYARPQSGATADKFITKIRYARSDGRNFDEDIKSSRYLPSGHELYPADMMISKVLCMSEPIYKFDEKYGTYPDETDKPEDDAVTSCTLPTDGEGNPTGSCCVSKIGTYVISYRKIDARWLNRMTNTVSSDMLWAIGEKPFNYNIGVILKKNNKWHFQGRIFLEAAYYFDRKAYFAAHGDQAFFPRTRMNKTSWEMPARVFNDFFTDIDGDTDFCDDGCIIRIQKF